MRREFERFLKLIPAFFAELEAKDFERLKSVAVRTVRQSRTHLLDFQDGFRQGDVVDTIEGMDLQYLRRIVPNILDIKEEPSALVQALFFSVLVTAPYNIYMNIYNIYIYSYAVSDNEILE